jgi:hypothetical protein
MFRVKMAAICILGASACASTPPQALEVATPSGRPEALLLTGEVSEAAGLIANGCMNSGMNVVSNNGYQVVCEASLTMTQSMVTQFALGNSYSTTPRQFVQFNLADIGDTVRAQATSWVETQMAFGQMKRMPTDQTIAQRNDLQRALFAFGGVPVPGTVDTSGRPKIGIMLADLSSDGEVGGTGAVFVTGVFAGEPASAAGLKVCDRIDAVNGAKIVNMAGYTLEVSRSAEGTPIKFSVSRAGEPLEFDIVATTSASSNDTATYGSSARIAAKGCQTPPSSESEAKE